MGSADPSEAECGGDGEIKAWLDYRYGNSFSRIFARVGSLVDVAPSIRGSGACFEVLGNALRNSRWMQRAAAKADQPLILYVRGAVVTTKTYCPASWGLVSLLHQHDQPDFLALCLREGLTVGLATATL